MNQYWIAELAIQMAPKYEPLLSRSVPYLAKGNMDCLADITTTEESYRWLEKKYNTDDRPLIEYMATGAEFYELLLSHSGLLLHSSAVEYEGHAYLFSAPSGTGKSTHTALWLKEHPGSAILNDDKPAIRILPDGIYVYGTPWSGKTDLSLNRKVKLQGICFLSRGTENKIEKADSMFSIRNILEQTVRPRNGVKKLDLMNLIDHIVRNVPIFRMECNMNPEAAWVSYQTMSKGEVK